MINSSPSYETLTVKEADGIVTVTLARPDTLNAITPTMCDELVAEMTRIHLDSNIRVVVLTGSGRAFSAGGDVLEDAVPVSKMTPWEYRLNVEKYASPILAIAELDRPVIAKINGFAVGGGWDLALACDMRIASERARFRDAYIQLGVIPELGGSYFLPLLAGLGRAKMISFTGEKVTAEAALRYGLVEEVVSAEGLDARVDEIARAIAKSPAKAVAMTKLAMNASLGMDLRGAIDYAKTMSPALVSSHDFNEAIAAFIEKREPHFLGR